MLNCEAEDNKMHSYYKPNNISLIYPTCEEED